MSKTIQLIRFDLAHLVAGGATEIAAAYGIYHAMVYCGWDRMDALCFDVAAALWGSFRVAQGLFRKWKIESLSISRFFSLSLAEMEKIKKERRKPREIYLGQGFVWGPEHAQAFHEVANLPEKDRHFPQITPEGGLPYIHNIGPALKRRAEQPQIYPLPEHTAIIGTTGIGKTRTFEAIIAQIVKGGDPVIVIDPKSDKGLLDAVYQVCLDTGRADRFDYVSLAHPQLSRTVNPFANYTTASEVAARITSIMPQTPTSKPFVDFCHDVLATVADVLILLQEPITLKLLYQYAVLDRESLQVRAQSYVDETTMPAEKKEQLGNAIRELETKINHDKGHFQKMTTSLLPVLKSLTSGNIGGLLSPSYNTGLSWDSIVNDKRVVYFSLASMRDEYVAGNVGKLIVQDLVSYIGNLYTRKSEYTPINLFVDEFYSVVYPGYVDIFNKSRAAGLRVFVGLQTTADIEAKVGQAVRSQIYGLVSNKIYMRIPDAEQAKELISTLGKCQIPKRTLTRNVSANLEGVHDLFKSGYAERLDLVDCDLLPAEIITSLPKGQAIVVTQGYPPIKINIPLLDRAGLPSFSFFEHIIGQYQSKLVAGAGQEESFVDTQWRP